MATWPSTLPGIRLPVQSSRQDGTIRTSMDAGPQKVRRRFTATSRYYSFPLQMTGSQFATLESFYDDTLGGGSLTFTMDDPHTGSSETFRFQAPPESEFIRGGENPNDRLLNVSISLERLP